MVKEGEELHLYQPATEKDWTKEMEGFCASATEGFSGIDGFVLKSRSPTCGFKDVRIYRGYEPSGGHEKGSGFFGGAVVEAFPGIPAEDEGRLKNWTIRDHFLTRIYTLARYRVLVEGASTIEAGAAADNSIFPSSLTDFHSRNKLLFMSIDQNRMRSMGRLLANHGKAAWQDVAREYRGELEELLKTPPKYTDIINTAMHAFGGLSSGLASGEKKYFLNLLEEYRDERIPASAVYTMLKGWAIRFDNRYLLGQTFLSPYPKELTDISGSGKGRDR